MYKPNIGNKLKKTEDLSFAFTDLEKGNDRVNLEDTSRKLVYNAETVSGSS